MKSLHTTLTTFYGRALFVLLLMSALVASVSNAQNTKNDVIPLPVGTTELLGDITTYTGHTYANNAVKNTAIVDLLNMDSVQLLLVFNDTASVASIKVIQLATKTASFGDTSATLGAFTSVAKTGGGQCAKRFHYITNVQAVAGHIARYARFLITYNSSGNDSQGTALTEVYALRYQKRREY